MSRQSLKKHNNDAATKQKWEANYYISLSGKIALPACKTTLKSNSFQAQYIVAKWRDTLNPFCK